MKELKTMIRTIMRQEFLWSWMVYNHIMVPFKIQCLILLPDGPDGRFQNGTGIWGMKRASEHEMYRNYMINPLTHLVRARSMASALI